MTDDRPEFLRRFFPLPEDVPARPPPPNVVAPGAATTYAAAALAYEVETLAATPESRRNNALNVAAFNVAQLVAANHLDHDTAWDALERTALFIGLTPTETRATLRSAFGAGALHPRVVAELDQPDPPAVTHIDMPADQAGQEPPGIGDLYPSLIWPDLWADDTPDDWILEPLLPARRLVALFSAPKVGKSLLLLELAVKVSLGHTFLGAHPDRAHRVMYIDHENDPRGDIRTRLRAMGYGPHHLADLVYLSYPRMDPLDTAMGGRVLLAIVEHYRCDVVVIDTISRAVKGDENDNDTWLSFYRHTGVLLKAAGIACIRLDHAGKDPTRGMRGGSAKAGDVDLVWSMRAGLVPGTYRLVCEAHRMPVDRPFLTITRETTPLLRHINDMDKATISRREEEDRVIDALNEYGFPIHPPMGRGAKGGLRTAMDLMPDLVGHDVHRAIVDAALKRRRDRDDPKYLDPPATLDGSAP